MSLEREQKTITAMIKIFCKAHHKGPKGCLCPDCTELLDYSGQRLMKCPFGLDKGPCAKCTVHCYEPEMRERIKEVMRYSGRKMLTSHPILTIDHLLKNKGATKKHS